MSNNKIEEFFDKKATLWDINIDHDLNKINNLLDEINIKENDDILDVGAGTGIITPLLNNRSKHEVIAIDISKKMIEIAKNKYKDNQNLVFLNDDFYNFKYDHKFNKIIFFDSYPHFLNLNKLKESLLNNLKSDGQFIILHDLGREKLFNIHSKNNDDISRVLNSTSIEAKFYLDSFKLIKESENESHYLLILKKNTNE